MAHIDRRTFLALTGATALAAPFPAFAQPAQAKRLALLFSLTEADPQTPRYLGAVREGLQSQGWTEGRNLTIDYRYTSGLGDLAVRYASELVNLRPNAVLSFATAPTTEVAKLTKTIPIVFCLVPDTVAETLAGSLGHPNGNATGFINFEPSLGSKWLGLLKEVAPGIRRAGLLFNPDTFPDAGGAAGPFEAAARTIGVEAVRVLVREAAEIAPAIAAFAAVPGSGLIVSTDALLLNNRAAVLAEVAKHKLPTVFSHVLYAQGGAAVTYGIDPYAISRQGGEYAGRVLSGTAIRDLPVRTPTRFQLVLNARAAAELGITLPQALLAGADEVIG